MVAQGLLTFGDLENLKRYVGTSKYYIIFNIHAGDIHLFFKAFSQFGDGYNTSRKEPGMCIRPVGMALPTIVLESGWSESRPQLYKDRGLWLKGGAGSVQLVMVIKWTKNAAKRVKGDIEVFNVDGAGNANLIANEVGSNSKGEITWHKANVLGYLPRPELPCRCARPNHHHQQGPSLGSASCQRGHCSSASDHYG